MTSNFCTYLYAVYKFDYCYMRDVQLNKKYVLSNSEVCPMQLFHVEQAQRDVHPVQNMLLCTKFHQNRMIFHRDMAI